MKTKNQENKESIYAEFVLSPEEMICIKGGGEPDQSPTSIPVKI